MASRRRSKTKSKFKPRPMIRGKIVTRKQKKLDRAQEAIFLLDSFNADDIERWKQRFKELFDFQWREYAHYAHIRAQKNESLRNSFLEVSTEFKFSKLFRAYALKYNPLSAAGSRISAQGGRFNYGNIDAGKFPSFPALYLGENPETAFREKFQAKDENPFSSAKNGLISQSSFGVASVSGEIASLVDITLDDNLKPFLKQIKKLLPPEELSAEAKRLGLNPSDTIRTMSNLKKALLSPDWSLYPTLLDIPSNSQVFGLIAKLAGIQAIKYRSKFGTGYCIAVFPENFVDSTSYIEVTDIPGLSPRRLDKDTCRALG